MSDAPNRRFQSLDHWRGLACLLVIVYHSTLAYNLASSQGASQESGWVGAFLAFTYHLNVGVAMFFVISGYCIAAAADSARKQNSSIGQYFLRRFRRIYPPYWIVIVLSIGAYFVLDYGWMAHMLTDEPWGQPRPWWYTPSQWIGTLTLTETWRHHVFGAPGFSPFPGQGWTLCYEEQFYFVTGILLLCRRRGFFWGVAAVSLVTVIVAQASRVADLNVHGWFFDGSWLLFAAGVAVFYRIHYATAFSARVLDIMLVGAVVMGAVVPIPIYGAVVGFGFAAALPWLYKVDAPVASAALLRPLLRCGQMCYSLYLVHQLPVKAITSALHRSGVSTPAGTALLGIPLSIAASVALGWGFHIAVERRFLNSAARTPLPATERATPYRQASPYERLRARHYSRLQETTRAARL